MSWRTSSASSRLPRGHPAGGPRLPGSPGARGPSGCSSTLAGPPLPPAAPGLRVWRRPRSDGGGR
eukprot:14222501-Alexandrium_andersonii.AAC.1